MLIGQGLVAGIVIGVVLTLYVQRQLRKRRQKIVGTVKGPLERLWGAIFGSSADDKKKGGRN